MPNRSSIGAATEAQVLKLSLRRCCICFGLHQDHSVKPGQIAHLDKNPSNNSIHNLAFLCLPCHDEYDTKTSQRKGFTITEVKAYREELHVYNSRSQSKCEMCLELDRDYDSFTDQELDKLIKAITELSGIGSGVRVVRKDRGSVLLTIEVTLSQAKRVLDAVRTGELDSHKVLLAQILRRVDGSAIGDEEWLRIVSAGVAVCREYSSHDDDAAEVKDGLPDRNPFRSASRGGRLYVGGLSFNTTSAHLEEVFSQYGVVAHSQVICDRETGRSRGFAYVELKSGLVDAVQGLNGAILHGRKIIVREDRIGDSQPRSRS